MLSFACMHSSQTPPVVLYLYAANPIVGGGRQDTVFLVYSMNANTDGVNSVAATVTTQDNPCLVLCLVGTLGGTLSPTATFLATLQRMD